MWYNKYIGIPYKDTGRDEAGLDCWGLVRLVYRDQYNIQLPSFSDEYTTAQDRELVQELIAKNRENWQLTAEPAEGSVILMRVMGTETHVGIYLGDGKMLHVREGQDVVVESVTSSTWKTRIIGYFNYTEKSQDLLPIIAAPNPLKTQILAIPVAEGTSLKAVADYISSEHGISDKLYSKIVFMVNGKAIPEANWGTTYIAKEDTVEYRAVPKGGSVGRMLMMLAVVYVAIQTGMYVGGTAAAPGIAGTETIFGGSLGMSSGYAFAAQSAVMIAGTALVNAIAPIRPPDMPGDPGSAQAQNLINGAQNQAAQYAALPVVLGKMRVTPPLGATNYVHFSGDSSIPTDADIKNSGGVAGSDTFVDMLLVWGYGPLAIDISTLRIGQVNVYNTNDGSLNYTNFKAVHLDRISDATTASLQAAFDATYGRDVQQDFPNQPLTYDGLPPSRGEWTPQPKPSTDTGWVEYGFSQNSESLSVAIGFPQGLRAIKVQGDNAGSAYAAPVGIQIQYKVGSSGTWTNWNSNGGLYYIGGQLSSGGSQQYQSYGCDENGCGWYTYTTTSSDNQILGGGPIKDAFTWTVSLNRQEISNNTVTLTRWQSTDLIQIRIRRVTGDNTEPNSDWRYSHSVVVQAVTSFNNSNPCIDPPNSKLAKSAITIQATDEINGQIDGINALVQTVCKDWDSGAKTWVVRATSNPASLYRYVLQHPANAQPVTDAQLDLVQLQHWHEYCNQSKTISYYYNGVLTTHTGVKLQYNSVLGGSQRAVLEVLRDICAAGRASPSMVDGKWSVVIDEPKSTVIQHFTPHNSWGFEATKVLPRMPEALKVQFNDRDSDYVQKEIVVSYADKNVNTAQLLESIQLPGVTSTGEAVDHARWHLAQIKLRPEVYSINTDIEYIVCNRGDRVKVTHDVPMWGVGSARVKNILGTSDTNLTVLELDDILLIDPTKNYTVRTRNSNDGGSHTYGISTSFGISSISVTSNIVTVLTDGIHPLNVGDIVNINSSISAINGSTGAINTLIYNSYGPIGFTYSKTLSDISTTSATGTVSLITGYYKSIKLSIPTNSTKVTTNDLLLFGELNKESQDLIVTKIEPTTNKTARITLVDYGVTDTYNIFTDYLNVSSSTIFEAQITQPPIALFNQVADSRPIVDVTKIISDERVIRRISPGVFEYVIRVPYTNPTGLSNDIGYVSLEVMPANMPDTTGSKTYTVDISLNSIDIPDVQESQTYRFRMRYVTKSGKVGTWTSWYGHKVIGKTNPPAAVQHFQNTIISTSNLLHFMWDSNLELDIVGYEIRTSDANWGDNDYTWRGKVTQVDIIAPVAGVPTTYYIRAYDYGNNYSTTSSSILVSIPKPSQVSNVSYKYAASSNNTNSTVTFSWDPVTTHVLDIKEYEVTVARPSAAVEVIYTASTKFTTGADWLGDVTLSIVTLDIGNNRSNTATLTVPKYPPNPITSLQADVVDNNVLLKWSMPAISSLPPSHVLVKRGTSWIAPDLIIGEKNGTFTSVFELTGGTYTYQIAVVDTDGRESTPVQKQVTVAQPPDFVFNREFISTFNGTKTNCDIATNTSDLLMLINTSETWQQHYTSHSWNTSTDQITAGYPIYAQPGLTTAQYQEVFDYGQLLASSNITVNFSTIVISGNPTVIVELETRIAGGSWSTPTVGSSMYATNFQQIRLTIKASANSAGDLVELRNLSVRLDSKQSSDSGSVSALSTDSLGTIVNFNREFIDIQSVVVSPQGTTPLMVPYDFKDTIITGTYSISSGICTINATGHGLITGQAVRLGFATGTATTGVYVITKITNDQYTVSTPGQPNTSGTVVTYPQSLRVYVYDYTGTRQSTTVSWSVKGY